MSPALVTTLGVAMFAVHAWIILGHRQKMGAQPGDRPQDPIFTRRLQIGAFAFVLGVQAMALGRRVALAFGAWPPPALPGGTVAFMDFLPLPASEQTLVAGVLVFAGGAALRLRAIRILGRFFTFEIGIRPDHAVLDHGPYRLVRHPSYTGYLLMLAGMGIAYASLFATLGLVLGAGGFLTLRMRHEERMLLKHFGKKYADYMERTKRLVPFVY